MKTYFNNFIIKIDGLRIVLSSGKYKDEIALY